MKQRNYERVEGILIDRQWEDYVKQFVLEVQEIVCRCEVLPAAFIRWEYT